MDEDLSFNSHVVSLTQKLKVKLGFYFRNKARNELGFSHISLCVSFCAFLLYSVVLCLLVYHSALRFIPGVKYSTHLYRYSIWLAPTGRMQAASLLLFHLQSSCWFVTYLFSHFLPTINIISGQCLSF